MFSKLSNNLHFRVKVLLNGLPNHTNIDNA